MRKMFIGVVIGILVTIPASALAANYELRWTNNIYNISDVDNGHYSGTVSVFDDQGNKCYVARATGGTSSNQADNIAISCIGGRL